MSYTKIITDMVAITRDAYPMNELKTHVRQIGLTRVYEQLLTIAIRGGRQTGHTTTLVEWWKNHPSIIVCGSMVTHNDLLRDIDLPDKEHRIVRLPRERALLRVITSDIKYILVDDSNIIMDNRELRRKLYDEIAATGRHDLIVILM